MNAPHSRERGSTLSPASAYTMSIAKEPSLHIAAMSHAHGEPAMNSPRRGRLAALALSASLLIAGPAAADEIEDTSQKFTDIQKLGYLGRTSKHALTQSVLTRLSAKTAAPSLNTTADRVIFWHDVLLDTIAMDHTGSEDFDGLPPFVQGGPGRTSRALAMVTIAMYDAGNAYDKTYEPYLHIAFDHLTRRS